ncbi:MAG TPA: alpha/beta fold hydrolase [Anaerolineae bacterium]|jgi:phospholipase/carboxylesterase|nr:alpha/beta fold hydrolase [Anaerolineae bacterium]
MPAHSELLFHLTRPPLQKDSAAPPLLLLLHGVGSNEEDLFELSKYLDPRFFIVSARAPIQLMPGAYAWYHVQFLPDDMRIDFREVEHSRSILQRFIAELIESYQVDPDRVYLMGFSQGAIMSLSLALTEPDRLAAIVAMSGRLLPELTPQIAAPEMLKDFPIFMAHGLADNVIPIRDARAAHEQLSKLPVDLTYREYPMGHQVSIESLNDIAAWLKDQLDRKPASKA